MNERFRLPVAILVSLLIHFALLLWVIQLIKIRLPESNGLMQVFLQSNAQESGRPPQAKPSINIAQTQPAGEPEHTPTPPQSATSVHQAPSRFPFQNPTFNQQAEQMNAMRLAQLAQQREMHRASVMAAMSNLAAQLRPVVKTRIVCAQQANNKIDCTPEPDEKVRPLLEHFFGLAAEARHLGIADNPVHIDFGPEQEVSVKLLP